MKETRSPETRPEGAGPQREGAGLEQEEAEPEREEAEDPGRRRAELLRRLRAEEAERASREAELGALARRLDKVRRGAKVQSFESLPRGLELLSLRLRREAAAARELRERQQRERRRRRRHTEALRQEVEKQKVVNRRNLKWLLDEEEAGDVYQREASHLRRELRELEGSKVKGRGDEEKKKETKEKKKEKKEEKEKKKKEENPAWTRVLRFLGLRREALEEQGAGQGAEQGAGQEAGPRLNAEEETKKNSCSK